MEAAQTSIIPLCNAIVTFQKSTKPAESPKDTGRFWKLHKRRKEDRKHNISRENKWIHCPTCRHVKTSSEWHLMDHFTKRHYKECQTEASLQYSTEKRSRPTYLVRRLFNKYTHTRKTQDESISGCTFQQTAQV